MTPFTKSILFRLLGMFLIAFTLIFTACSSKQLPVDNEQLSDEERIVIRFSHIVSENTPKGLAARRFSELIKERTNGFIEVQVFPNGYLYRDGEEMDALLDGDIQMIAPAMSKLSRVVPEWEVMDLPFAFENSNQVHQFLNGEVGKRLLEKLEMKGFQPLAIWDNGFKQMTNSLRPLKQPTDFNGLRFRVMPSSVLEDQFRLFGATTLAHTFNEVYQLLERKETNAQENTFSNIYSKNLHSLQSFLTVSNHGYLGYVVLMNRSFWQSLPEEIRHLIQTTLEEVTEWEMEIAKELNEDSFMKLRDCHCIEIHHLTEEEKLAWKEALLPVYESFKNKYGSEYLSELK